MKRVLFLSPWAEMGGAERILVALCKGMRNFSSSVAFFHDGSLVKELGQSGCMTRVVAAPRLSRPWELMRATAEVRSFAREVGADVIFSHAGWAHCIGSATGMLSRIPSVWYQHGPPKPDSKLDQMAAWMPTRQIYCNSAFTLERQRAMGSKRLLLVPYGIDSSAWRFDLDVRDRTRMDLGIRPESVVITLAARFERWKGHEVLLEAAQMLQATLPGAKFLIAGGSLFGLEKGYEESLRKRASSNVIFTGFRSNMSSIYCASDIVVSASIEPETFGLTVAEAMLCERPIVGTRLGALPEVIEDGVTGNLVTPGNATELAQAIRKLAVDPKLRSEMGKRGRERIRDRFALDLMIKKIETDLLSILDR